jgi:RHS repeat-associated protein
MPTPFRHRLWLGLIFWLVWTCSVAAGSCRPATNAVGAVAEVATYDGLDRMLTETSVGVAHTNSWDKQGNRLQVVQGRTGRIVQSGYDRLNRLVRMEERLPSEPQSRTTLYSYDRNGNVVQKTQANGLVELTEYDALNRRTRQELKQGTSSLNAYAYAYDRQSNLCGMVESFAQTSAITVAGQTITNTYDKAYRLIEEDVTKDGKRVTTSYSHDAANNRTQKSVLTRVSGQPDVLELHTYTYGDASNGLNSNQLATWTRSNGPQVTYTYDANGNRATRVEGAATDTYAYDYWNRLVELNLQSGDIPGTYRYAYDHRTRRVVRDESAVTGRTRDLIVFSSGLSAQEYTGATGNTPTGQPHVEYMRGSDWGGGVGGILYSLTDGQPSWSHNNGRGDITVRSDGAGVRTWAASYEAFGTRPAEAGVNPDPQRGNSKDEDPTGLLNEGFRYRDLETGVFITRDPAGFVDGPNVYTYVVQNPWTGFDPEGLNTSDWAGMDGWSDSQEEREGIQKGQTMAGEIAAQVYAEVAIGLTPAGVALDAKDFGTASEEVYEDPTNGWKWCGLAVAGAAFCPGPGDIIKGSVKGFKRMGKALDEAVSTSKAFTKAAEGSTKAIGDSAKTIDKATDAAENVVDTANKTDDILF